MNRAHRRPLPELGRTLGKAQGAIPALLVLGVFFFFPFLEVIRFSTWRWSGLSQPTPVGLANYRELFADPVFFQSVKATLIFAALTLPAFLILSLLVALALEGQRYERVVKGILFLPGLVTVGAASTSWYTLFAPEYGALASFLPIPAWDQAPFWAMIMVVAFTLWRYLGYGVLVVSAHLKSIPRAVLEAAMVDGASGLEVTRYVVLPLLRPAVLFLTVVGTVLALQSYVAVFLLTRGGPYGATRVLGYLIYELGFENFRLGYAAAVTVVMLALTVAVAWAQGRLLEER